MASSCGETGASTPGNLIEESTPGQLREADLGCLKCGQWNMGLADEHHGKNNDKINTHIMPVAALVLNLMCQHVHLVVLNELHITMQARFKAKVESYKNLQFLGCDCGDGVVWRRST